MIVANQSKKHNFNKVQKDKIFSIIAKPMHYIKSVHFNNRDHAQWHDAKFSFQVGTRHSKRNTGRSKQKFKHLCQ